MLEDLKKIPTTDIETDIAVPVFREINGMLTEAGLHTGVVHNWDSNGASGIIAQTLNMFKNTKPSNIRPTLVYTTVEYSSFIYSTVTYKGSSYHGLVINEEAATHFNAEDINGIKYLEKAQEYMKQTSQHFLRIFTVPDCNILFVYTNKTLHISDIYKLLQLCDKVFPQNNEYFNALIEACIKEDAAKARKIITDYLTSDEVIKIRFKQFRDCLAYQKNNKIQALINRIDETRDRINNYERSIANLSSEIRTLNENIAFYKSTETDEEDDKELFNYLTKSPYIKKFNSSNSGKIIFEYTSPIIYFNDYPAEKTLEQAWRSPLQKDIIRILLGRKYTLWTKCQIEFRLDSYEAFPQRARHATDLLPQPHIDRFGCFGNHLDAVRDAAEAGNILGAIEQITQATMNINFYDSCVVNWMLEELERTIATLPTWKCEETGEWLTTATILERGDYNETIEGDC